MSKILEAIRFATAAHSTQTRKGKKDVPYITHPLAVGVLLANAGAKEDVVVAGILHDTIEDTDVTFENIEEIFGKDVARMVNDVTEQERSLPWAERKKAALEHVPHMSHDSIMVKSADLLHNMTDQIIDYELDGDEMFVHFNASKVSQLERYEKLVKSLRKTWGSNPLLAPLEEQLVKLRDLWS
jgi:(p)ppGpp synthase/HD superfamily hydrolase